MSILLKKEYKDLTKEEYVELIVKQAILLKKYMPDIEPFFFSQEEQKWIGDIHKLQEKFGLYI